MQAQYDAIVIGTGFGGAVSACRLSQAGLKVGVLERGRRYPLGGFPRTWNDPFDGWLWSTKQGLFDIRPFEQMMVVQSAGYGGGSLIYANVHLRVPPSVFASGWPANYSREVLDPYYDLVAYMLDIAPITTSPLGVPPKATLMQQAATALGRADQFCFPNIAVDLGAAEAVHANKFGVNQSGCRYCGECVIGCNFHSKNTLDLNYLALAQTRGADVTVQCEVTRIEPAAGGNGYLVSFVNHAAGGAMGQTAAARVFLCAGAVNSTELLLKCRDEYQTLPNLSNQLGLRYSGNGDFLAFAFDTSTPAKPSDGPTITAGIVYDRPQNGSPVWFILEEGGYPKEIGGLLQAINPKGGFLKGEAAITAFALRDQLLGAARAKAATMAASDNTQVFLAMGRDTASGRIGLSPVAHDLQIKWDTVANLPLYDAEARLVADFAGAMGGRPVDNPFWHVLHQPVSVHNLGGCVMGDSSASGVTDPNGEVYGYPGLYVMDGAILPAATGVNPSHTIAAVAERNVEAAIRNLKQDPNWTAPERAEAKPVVDPTSKITVPAGGTAPPKTQAIGLGFTETMKGYGVKGFQPTDDYAGGEHAGKRVGTIIDFTLTITTPDLDAFLADPNGTAIANGVVQVDGFTGPGGAPVADGVFNLFVPTGQADQRKMLYALPFTGTDGNPYLLDGFKDVKDNGRFDVWGATSTLYTVIRSGHDRSGAIVETGILHILMQDFMHQLTTFKVTGTTNPAQKADALARFGKRFFGTLWGVFVLPHFERSRT